MRIQKAKVHLTNGEIADLILTDVNISDWMDEVSIKGVQSEEMYIPHNSITYVQFEEPVIADLNRNEKDGEVEVEVEYEEEE